MLPKFTKYEKEEKKIESDKSSKYNSDDLNIITYKSQDIITSSDKIVVLPYFRDDGYILLQHQRNYNFNYKLKDKSEFKDVLDFLSIISTDVETSPIYTVRETMKKCGVILNAMTPIQVDAPIFRDSSQTGQYYPCVLELGVMDYKVIQADPNFKCVKIDLGYLDDIKKYDVITNYMLLQLKYLLKL